MDWLGIERIVRPHVETYFFARSVSPARIEIARNKDIGEGARQIDAAVRALFRQRVPPRLSEDEADMLAIRLHWAWQVAYLESQKPFEKIELGAEDELESVLIDLWHAGGRLQYRPRLGFPCRTLNKSMMLARLKTTKLPPPGEPPFQR
jgi:hypothetical protein